MSTTRIPDNKKRITITLEKSIIDAIQKYAEKNRRKVSDEISILIERYVINNREE